MKKILALFDSHIPHHIPLGPVFEFARDFKPDILVLGGDMHDFGSVSHWVSDQSRHLDGGILLENYEELRRILLDPLRSIVGKKCEKIYLEGNHENWIATVTMQMPNLRGYVELRKNIPKDYRVVPMNKPYRPNSNLAFIHGTYSNMYHARKTVENYMTSVIYGHLHTFQTFTKVSPVDNKNFYTAMAIGSLCTLNPAYMKNRPSAWINGLAYGWLGDHNTFSIVPVVIVRNSFWAEGKHYV